MTMFEKKRSVNKFKMSVKADIDKMFISGKIIIWLKKNILFIIETQER